MLSPIFNFGAIASAIYPGDARLVAWALAWDGQALLTGHSLFDANIFYPAPEALAYGEHFFGIALFALPVYAITRNAVLAYNIVWLLSFLFSAAAAHVIVWRITRDHLASFVSGVLFAFCFFRMHHGHGHLHLLWAFWIPLAILAMERWLAAASWLWLWTFVALVVLQALSSWYQAVLVFVATALFMLYTLVLNLGLARPRAWIGGRIARLGVQSLIGALAALAVIWPFARHYRTITSGGPAEAAVNSADLAAYLVPPQNTWIGRWLMQHGISGPRWIWGELTLYVGWLTLLLAIGGAVVALRNRTESACLLRYFLLLAVLSVALAAGPSAQEVADNAWHWSWFGALAHIPGADLFRAPARFAALLTLALAILAGACCAALHQRYGRTARVLTFAALPWLLFESYVVDFPGGPPPPTEIPPVYRLIASLPAGPVMTLPDYAGTPQWFNEADYQFFSTAHWRPIVNGYTRAEPAGYRERIAALSTFPDDQAIGEARRIRVRYVVVHAARYPGGGQAVERAARVPHVRLVAQHEADYLFEID
jgi:hypothetical protein